MKNKLFIGLVLFHFGCSLLGFLGLSGWAVATQDAGSSAVGETAVALGAPESTDSPPAGGSLRWPEALLRFVLLQPLAHWVLQADAIAWWTWPGVLALAVLVGLNSLIASGVVIGCLRGYSSLKVARK